MLTPAFSFKTGITIALFLLSACCTKEHRNNEITKIEIATGGCFGPCQYTALSIDSSLTYKYYGGEILSRTNRPEDKFKIEGYYTGKINRSL